MVTKARAGAGEVTLIQAARLAWLSLSVSVWSRQLSFGGVQVVVAEIRDTPFAAFSMRLLIEQSKSKDYLLTVSTSGITFSDASAFYFYVSLFPAGTSGLHRQLF